MTKNQDLNTQIKTTIKDANVFVDEFDDGVWLSIQIAGGGANCVMTSEQAREMIAAVNRILEAQLGGHEHEN